MNKIVLKKASIVTGGCGFVGRHMVNRLVKQREDVIIVDDLSIGKHPDTWLVKMEKAVIREPDIIAYEGSSRVIFFHMDARDFFRNWKELFTAFGMAIRQLADAFHFAAVVGGRAKIEGDPIAVAIDLAIDAGFFNWAVRAKPERILYASSSAAYPIDLQGEGSAVRLREDHITFDARMGQPDMTYGWAKLTGEYLARLVSANYGLHAACVRPFSGYGEDQDNTYPVPAIAARAAHHEDPLVIWGSGNQGRDFVHIDDCVDAIFLALDSISDGSGVNIGSGKLMTFKEVAQLFSELAGYSPRIKPLTDKPTGVYSRYADTTLMAELLQWTPSISLREGFLRVLRAAQKQVKKNYGS